MRIYFPKVGLKSGLPLNIYNYLVQQQNKLMSTACKAVDSGSIPLSASK